MAIDIIARAVALFDAFVVSVDLHQRLIEIMGTHADFDGVLESSPTRASIVRQTESPQNITRSYWVTKYVYRMLREAKATEGFPSQLSEAMRIWASATSPANDDAVRDMLLAGTQEIVDGIVREITKGGY